MLAGCLLSSEWSPSSEKSHGSVKKRRRSVAGTQPLERGDWGIAQPVAQRAEQWPVVRYGTEGMDLGPEPPPAEMGGISRRQPHFGSWRAVKERRRDYHLVFFVCVDICALALANVLRMAEFSSALYTKSIVERSDPLRASLRCGNAGAWFGKSFGLKDQ